MSSAVSGRTLLTLLLAAAFGWSLAAVDWRAGVVNDQGLPAFAEFLVAALQPDLRPSFVGRVIGALWQTVAYAVAGMTVAIVIGGILGPVASGALARRRVMRWAQVTGARALLGFFRAIHELVWAWLFIAALGLSPLAGVLALGVPYGGILGLIYAQHLADVPAAPLRALQTTGARPWQVFFYGRLPLALPDLVSYTLYRFECGLRAAAVFSFVGLGGLGAEIQLSLSELNYREVWTLLITVIALILFVDWWSGEVRRRMTT
ncbi:MAG: ABC transporter permease subunit [Chloroflexota bacterium]|nr:ABC transporter permease subunit [Dehalococcoidia bacterium]MDW8252864.1 ABC transporter permease subunit [Chloroflexota bacterium]